MDARWVSPACAERKRCDETAKGSSRHGVLKGRTEQDRCKDPFRCCTQNAKWSKPKRLPDLGSLGTPVMGVSAARVRAFVRSFLQLTIGGASLQIAVMMAGDVSLVPTAQVE